MAKLIDDLRNIAIYVQQNAVSVQCSVLPFRCVVNDCIILGMRYSPRCNDLHETSSSSHLNMRMNFTSRKISTAHYMIRLRIIAFAFENKTGSLEAISIYFASTVTQTGISFSDTQKWSLLIHYIEHIFNKEIQK